MQDLPNTERFLFLGALLVYLAAALVATVRLRESTPRQLILTHLIGLGVVFETALLVFRAGQAHALPLTNRFESLVLLSVAFGVTYLVLGVFFRQTWFAAGMSWLLLGLALLTSFTAQPLEPAPAIVRRPWVVAHALAMISGEAALLVGAVAAGLFLLARRRLKDKRPMSSLDAVPNLQKLERLNLQALRVAFVLLSLGLVAGLGMAALKGRQLHLSPADWVGDPRTLCFLAAWIAVALALAGQFWPRYTARLTAWTTLAAFVLLLGSLVSGRFLPTAHEFSGHATAADTSRMPQEASL